VFFRRTTLEEALRLGVAGWVRNRVDGRVELEAEGPEEAVEEFLRYCRRGPQHARVDELAVTERPPQGEVRFSVLGDGA